MAFEPITLAGAHVTLMPLSRAHHDGLVDAVRDGDLWRLWYTAIPHPDAMLAEIDRRLTLQQAGTMLPFTVIDTPTGRIAGMTTFMHIDAVSPRVEIGSTFYAARMQRSALNTQAKLLLLAHAFDVQGCLAVEFRTHVMNHQSRRAIERLGVRLDGILRQHQRAADGSLRDTCVYSIIASEWPMVRQHLQFQLDRR